MRSLLLIAVLAGMASMAGPSAAAPDPDLLVLDDFEGEMRWEGVTPSLKVVHGGKRAGRWHDLKTTPRIAMKSVPKDWSRYDRICFWLHSRKANKQTLTLLLQSDNPKDEEGWDYYYHHFEVDWEGWRFFSLRFGHEIQVSRSPRGWDQIDGMSLSASGWGHSPLPDTELTLDDVVLVRDPVAVATLPTEVREADGSLIAETIVQVTNRSSVARAFSLEYDRGGLRDFRLDAPSKTPRIEPDGRAQMAVRLILPPARRAEAQPLARESIVMKVLTPGVSEGVTTPPPVTVEVAANVPLPHRAHPRLFATAADLAAAKARAERLPWAKAVYDRILAAAGEALEAPLDVPDKGGQWPHHYACPKHGRSLQNISPTEHRCPVDGEVFSGWPYDDVIITRRHGRNASAVVNLGLAFQWTGDRRYADKAAAIFREYAVKYPTYAIHNSRGRESRSGARMYAQTLDEAVSFISFAWGYDLMAESGALSQEDQKGVEERFFREAARIIQRNDAKISNWQSWHNAGVGAIGFALNDAALAGWALHGPSGLMMQLSESVLADGWWYEGAPAYHFYALAALVDLAEAARLAGIDVWRDSRMKRLFDAPLLYTYPDLRIPAVNDSDVFSLTGQAALYEIAYARLRDDCYLPVLAGERKSREALLWGVEALPAGTTPAALPSHHFSAAGTVVLRAGEAADATYVHLDYGPHGGGHGHPDKLNLILFSLGKEVSPDPGRLAYSVPAHQSWYRQTVAHNTVVVDGSSQMATEGSLAFFAPGGALQVATGLSTGAYPEVTLKRTLALVAVPGRAAPPYLVDFYTATAKAERTFDWVYHNRGELRGGEAAPTKPLAEGHGYQHLERLRRAA
ncbi:MAG TPA: alginate lyase family protein, partial [Armatimonadetes bacterium]|nr:alginate lyase family protein [Armatimonadota bacterium]